MSDDEEVYSGEEEESEAEEESREATPERDEPEAAPAASGPSEAELAMQRRRQAQSADFGNLDEEAKELLASNMEEREKMEDEISELKTRRERRKKEREQEEKQMAQRRSEEESRRKAEEEERLQKKQAEESGRREARAAKLAEFEKFKNPASSPNFVITKKSGDSGPAAATEEGGEAGEKKSKEQLEAEKRAILEQRTPKLDVDGADTSKLTDKAKEFHSLIMRLESEKYDLEKRFKAQQYDMMELSERARQMNKVGKGGTLKRVNMGDEEDEMASRHAGCPSKIIMYSEFERQTDARPWGTRKDVFKGATYLFPAEKVKPTRIVKFREGTGLPEYEYLEGCEPKEEEEEEE